MTAFTKIKSTREHLTTEDWKEEEVSFVNSEYTAYMWYNQMKTPNHLVVSVIALSWKYNLKVIKV